MDRKRIDKELKSIKKDLLSRYPEVKLLVVRSYARKEYVEGSSNIELIILSEKFQDKNIVQMLHEVNSFLEWPDFPIDLIPLPPKEYEKNRQRKTNTLYYMAKDAIAI